MDNIITIQVEKKINITELENDLEDLKKRLKFSTETKDNPDQETLDFWNNNAPLRGDDTRYVEQEIKELEQKLKEYKK
jgi:hypothetical protein